MKKKEIIAKSSPKRASQPVALPMQRSSKEFTKELAREIVKNLAAFGKLTTLPFQKRPESGKSEPTELAIPKGEYPVLVDTSVFIDGRILPIVNSGFLTATLLVPEYVLTEIQHIADSSDPIRRTKGRRGLDVINALRSQKVNPGVHVVVVHDTNSALTEVDDKLVALAKRWKCRLLTVDFNLAQVARAQGIKVMNINDLAQALKVALVTGEELTIKITHPGKEREQGVGYLSDGTMVVVEDTKNNIGQEVVAVVTKIHQTPAGQLFFARLK